VARLLGALGDVTVFTTDVHEPAYRRLRAGGDPEGRLAPGVEYVFVAEPETTQGYLTELHCYTARVMEAIAERYPGGGPDLIEAPDYLGEAFVLAQANATGDPRIERSLLAVRAHTSAEICAVLNGHLDDTDFETKVTAEMERYALRHADVLLWAGGDVLGLYERFYDRLAEPVRIRHPLRLDVEPEPPRTGEGGPLKLLYVGRMERRKGVRNLLRALTAIPGPYWELTLLGGDTRTAPLGMSMRGQLELVADADPRVRFADEVPREALAQLVREHDVVVMPSLWECWPYVALEALQIGRPVLATPVGGLTEIVQPGVSGWLTRDGGAEALTEALEDLIYRRDAIRAEHRDLRAHVAALTDEEEILDGYRALLARERPARRRRVGAQPPLVSVVVPYWRMAGFVEDTLRSIMAQTYPRIETIVVDDGSFEPDDLVLTELSTRYPISVLSQPNAGLGAARNFGISQARGRYVLPLDSDNMIEPEFVQRCVEVLEHDRSVAYVTAWTRSVDDEGVPLGGVGEGFQPIGNESELLARDNVAGDAAAVLRRRLFDLGFAYSQDLTSYEDWELYERLRRAGHEGLVIPDRLLVYRVRGDSMLRDIGIRRTQRLFGEIQAHIREREVRWAFKSG
jgi:glycosyltransferase involved in cell wall biosynthesis/GT2 family glycosyltransferase